MGIHPPVGLCWCFDLIPFPALFNCATKKGNYQQSVIADLKNETWATGSLEVIGETDGATRG